MKSPLPTHPEVPDGDCLPWQEPWISEKFALSPVARPIRELVAILLWSLMAIHVFFVSIDVAASAIWPQLEQFASFRGIAVIFGLSVALYAIRNAKWRFTFLYVLLYPLVVLLWKVPKLFVTHWDFLLATSPSLREKITSIPEKLLILSIYCSVTMLVFTSENTYALALAVSGLIAIIALHLIRRFASALSGRSALTDFKDFTKYARAELAHNPWFRVDTTKFPEGSQEYEDRCAANLFLAYMSHEMLRLAGERLRTVLHSGKLEVFLAGAVSYTFAFTTLSFSFVFFGLHKFFPSSFAGPSDPGWLTFLAYSFDNMVPAGHSGVSATAPISLTLSYIQSSLSVVIAVLLVFLLFNSMRDRYRHDLDETIRELEYLNRDFSGSIEESFSITLTATERILLRDNPRLVGKVIFWLRGSEYVNALFAQTKLDAESISSRRLVVTKEAFQYLRNDEETGTKAHAQRENGGKKGTDWQGRRTQ